MAAPRGPYTPRSGPFAGRTFYGTSNAPTAGYNEYQNALSAQQFGFSSYSQQKQSIAVGRTEAMYRVTAATMRANGATQTQINNAYLRMRQANGGKQPTRNIVRNTLQSNGTISQTEEPDWDAVS